MLERIKKIVETKMCIDDISKNCKKDEYVLGRAIYYYVAQETVPEDYSLERIGRFVNRDHAGVIHANHLRETYEQKQSFKKTHKRVMDVLILGKKYSDKKEKIISDIHDLISEQNDFILNLEMERERLINEIKNRENSAKSITGMLSGLSSEEMSIVKERLHPIISFLKSRRTYENTNKSEFNINNEKLFVNSL